MRVTGWALGDSSPVVSFEVLHRGSVIWEEPPLHHRGDALADHPDVPAETKAGFRATLGVVGLEAEFELELQVVLENGERRGVATVRGRRELLGPSTAGSLRPVRVVCMRRSGSTWLMHMLAEHPEIVVFPAYPYESAPARYWAHMMKVLSEPAVPAERSRRVRYAADPRRVGYNPYYDQAIRAEPAMTDWYGREYLEGLADLSRRSTEGWYRTVARSQGKTGAAFFAEKHTLQPGEFTTVWDELYSGGSDLLLVRDFRDMAYSTISFDRTHGKARFSDRPGEPYEPYVRRVMELAEELRDNWVTRREIHTVRYEDLVARPAETLTALFGHIGADASAATAEGIVEAAGQPSFRTQRHVTAPSVEESVGRWREEADDEFRALCDELLGDALRAFGYAEG